MKITDVICQIIRLESIEGKTAGTQDTVIIRVQTDEGIEGIGECDASPEICEAIINAPFSHNIACGLKELIIGEDPMCTTKVWDKMYKGCFYYGRRAVAIATMAGIDMALWDIKGKALNQPIHALLGGKQHDNFRAYASILFGSDGAETKDIGQRWVDYGYTAVKFGWEPMGESEAMDMELVSSAREALGPDRELLIDAGCVWDARTALKRAHSFSEYNIGWLEEPLNQDDLEGYVWLRDRSPVPIAAGEGECGRTAFNPWIDQRALDIYQVDLARCGFTDSMHIGKRVQDVHAKMVNHCYKTPISVAACLHWLSTFKEAFLFEDCVEDSPLRHDLAEEKYQAVDGFITVPDKPGLGITLNEDLINKYKVN
ncbi:MAG: mandelate racemase/muconate lactonizing enzyme family protein [Lentisphaeria bacterium]|nr:mandelate racemase/muconate lactonizing enzyme family protein [Lentisphaeria bacterium]NQZ67403.1 mandelate racemase/muconate lactonizing enzyme family protein [Lentisphaeria bacterium]